MKPSKKVKQRMIYLWNKEHCCSLDKQEMIELQKLIQKYGYFEYQ